VDTGVIAPEARHQLRHERGVDGRRGCDHQLPLIPLLDLADGRPTSMTRLYRITEAMGRWSMVDIFVVTILVALVRLGSLATIEAQTGAVFFGAVVVLTMLAAESFDPRLLWDRSEEIPR
jgi:paraquat-inducible protein A